MSNTYLKFIVYLIRLLRIFWQCYQIRNLILLAANLDIECICFEDSRSLFMNIFHTFNLNFVVLMLRLLQSFSQVLRPSFSHYLSCVRSFYTWVAIPIQFKVFSRKSTEQVAEEIFSYFSFNVWPGILTGALHLISQHTPYKTTATLCQIYQIANEQKTFCGRFIKIYNFNWITVKEEFIQNIRYGPPVPFH